MDQNQELINKLIEKLEFLYKKQSEFSSEMDSLKEQLYLLQSGNTEEKHVASKEESTATLLQVTKEESPVAPKIELEELPRVKIKPASQVNLPTDEKPKASYSAFKTPKSKSSLEKFIGENILNKIGIITTIIGVAIGAKYSIENELISPLTRIILGYLMAIGLLGFGVKLKNKYEAYSAVLVSGSIVILYFITFFAYNFYDLIPQLPTFALMVVFTAFTVVAAISYNRQVIAHIGLVGAYAVPFLLSDGSGRVEIMFSYMAIINVGILIISFKKHWKPLYYSAFIFTWLIFSTWYLSDYNPETQFNLALGFLFLFFTIFYITFLAYKMLKKETFQSSDVILLLVNSFLFYGFGYAILDDNTTGSQLLGVFTLFNAVIHFIVSVLFYKKKLGDKNLFYLASAMVLVFITITIPVQLNGNWVTLLWVSEAALLFWLGRTKGIKVYEKLSYPLMVLAFLSMVQDWSSVYDFNYSNTADNYINSIFNIHFLTSLLFVTAFGFIVWIYRKKEYVSAFDADSKINKLLSYAIPTLLVFSAYYAFRLEIEMYWNSLFYNATVEVNTGDTYKNSIKNYDLWDFKSIWVINYSLLFVTILSFINLKYLKNKILEKTAIGLTVATIFIFLSQGLYAFSELIESYLNPSEYFIKDSFYIWIRYVSFLFLALALYMCYKFMRRNGTDRRYKIAYDFILHVSILWTLSSELIHWMSIFESMQSYKLGLSILWGIYSFLLITFGIWKNKVYLRIGGMALFGITLIKLFFYDISHLNTISKTIVFVSLGLLLLIISFLYNKYKNKITDDVEY
ncbi:DUF2339 domain-containing protein [Winogradskyella sp. UBA3174]|uniref:DUF2339 domain-containing protein n=1 Tax=Winogradskyella sp. UBA3174 TaxID=1947785 RepID=UPI0025FC446A|nr:DUF2339 domain-containing protein [Winogradskyella sp. UBA3174]|tara:strand:+ start:53879 stop:56272 length:2394 start_codon:yes stop_codon:yes gene_type:complete